MWLSPQACFTCSHVTVAGFLQNEKMQERSDKTIYGKTHTIQNHTLFTPHSLARETKSNNVVGVA